MVRSFSNESFAPKMQTWDEHEIFPLEVLQRAASLGFGGIYVTDEKKGGSNMSRLEASIIFEALSTGCTSTAAFLSIHNMCSWMLDTFGSESLKHKYLGKMTSLQLVASYCLTEPGSGSDAASLKTTAIKEGAEYILNGSKVNSFVPTLLL